ncbi:MAG: hypothetical protein KKD39_06290 [Candidatus Altiarchaeota archaeon]|nr:hypothetical protein [Candidatus Altiarchaeota archaeon]
MEIRRIESRRIEPINPTGKAKDAKEQSEKDAEAQRQLPQPLTPKTTPNRAQKPTKNGGKGQIIDIKV